MRPLGDHLLPTWSISIFYAITKGFELDIQLPELSIVLTYVV
jgi:hypothetical protein